MEIIQSLQNRIYEIRGRSVILDKDIAQLYETETKSLNLSVKRHSDRFPEDFMFQLTKEEIENIRIQNISNYNVANPNLRFQIETSSLIGWGGSRYLPFAFTEQGVAMLSGIINSKKSSTNEYCNNAGLCRIKKSATNKSRFQSSARRDKRKTRRS